MLELELETGLPNGRLQLLGSPFVTKLKLLGVALKSQLAARLVTLSLELSLLGEGMVLILQGALQIIAHFESLQS